MLITQRDRPMPNATPGMKTREPRLWCISSPVAAFVPPVLMLSLNRNTWKAAIIGDCAGRKLVLRRRLAKMAANSLSHDAFLVWNVYAHRLRQQCPRRTNSILAIYLRKIVIASREHRIKFAVFFNFPIDKIS
jgi:hypothetical protein